MRNTYGELINELKDNHSMVMMTRLSSKRGKKIEKILLDLNKDDLLDIDEDMKNAINKANEILSFLGLSDKANNYHT